MLCTKYQLRVLDCSTIGVGIAVAQNSTAWAKLEEAEKWLERVDKLLSHLTPEQKVIINAADPTALESLRETYCSISQNKNMFLQKYMQTGWLKRKMLWGDIYQDADELMMASVELHLDALKTTNIAVLLKATESSTINAPLNDDAIELQRIPLSGAGLPEQQQSSFTDSRTQLEPALSGYCA